MLWFISFQFDIWTRLLINLSSSFGMVVVHAIFTLVDINLTRTRGKMAWQREAVFLPCPIVKFALRVLGRLSLLLLLLEDWFSTGIWSYSGLLVLSIAVSCPRLCDLYAFDMELVLHVHITQKMCHCVCAQASVTKPMYRMGMPHGCHVAFAPTFREVDGAALGWSKFTSSIPQLPTPP